MILTGILRSKVKRVDTPASVRDSRETDASRDQTDGKRPVMTDVARRYQTNSWQ